LTGEAPLELDLSVVGGTLVSPHATTVADVGIRGEEVAVIAAPGMLPPARNVIDASGCFVLPGLVDPHTHLGNTRPLAEDVASETRSAALGGVTTVMSTVPVTRLADPTAGPESPGDTSYLDAFPLGRRAVEQYAHVDVGFSFMIMTRRHATEIAACVRECGVTSFKFFTTFPSTTAFGSRVGMPHFPDEGTVFVGLRACADSDALAMVHAENGLVIEAVGADLTAGHSGLEAAAARYPGHFEASEIRQFAELARITGAHAYPVHLSSLEGMAAADEAIALGTRLTAETCVQYLTLDLERHAGRGPLTFFHPPIRHREHAEALWAAVADGRIQTIGSDHVSNVREIKMPDGGIESSTPGSPGVATMLPLLWTHGVRAGRITPSRLVELTAEAPARAFGLYPRKGVVRPGADADLVIVDPARPRVVDSSSLRSWSDFSAYEGMELYGWPTATVLRGRVVAENGAPVGQPGGRYLARPLA
jgi:dihydropyrimidinase